MTKTEDVTAASKTATDVLDLFECHSRIITREEAAEIIAAVNKRSTLVIAETIVHNVPLRRAIVNILGQRISKKPDDMRSKKRGKSSVTLKTSFNDLRKHSWYDYVSELSTEFPEILILMINLMLPMRFGMSLEGVAVDRIVPKLGMVYAMMMNCRYNRFNAAQTVISCILMDNVVDSKVYDRLNAVGLCISYCTMCSLMDRLSKNSDVLVKDALTSGKFYRIVGDNLNYTENVREERREIHKCMHHYFLSNVLVSDPITNDFSDHPKIGKSEVKISDFIPTRQEIEIILTEVLPQVAGVACSNLLFLGNFKDCLKRIALRRNEKVSPTKVYCLGALPFNESLYQDDVRILEYYQNKIKDWYDGDIPSDVRIVIGGDLLTAERFRYAKMLRLGNCGPEGFENIGDVVFEFFHLQMKYLQKVYYKTLWNEKSTAQGTLKTEAERISRKSVNPGDNNHYTENKDFADSFTSSLLIVALQTFFGLDDLNGLPTKHCPPSSENIDEKTEWLQHALSKFISEYALHGWLGFQTVPDAEVENGNTVVERRTVTVTLRNGFTKNITLNKVMDEKVIQKQKKDSLKNYSHLALELGIVSFAFDSLCSNPDYERFMIVSKMIMMMLKSSHSQGKYAYYICRMLVQHLCLLSEKDSRQLFSSNFVRTKKTFVPADRSCEWSIGQAKRLIKHMGPNRSISLIEKRTRAMPSISEVTENYDRNSNVVQRFKVHGHQCASGDESAMVEDLVKLDPFVYHPGRDLEGFSSLPDSIMTKLDHSKYCAWLQKCSEDFLSAFV